MEAAVCPKHHTAMYPINWQGERTEEAKGLWQCGECAAEFNEALDSTAAEHTRRMGELLEHPTPIRIHMSREGDTEALAEALEHPEEE